MNPLIGALDGKRLVKTLLDIYERLDRIDERNAEIDAKNSVIDEHNAEIDTFNANVDKMLDERPRDDFAVERAKAERDIKEAKQKVREFLPTQDDFANAIAGMTDEYEVKLIYDLDDYMHTLRAGFEIKPKPNVDAPFHLYREGYIYRVYVYDRYFVQASVTAHLIDCLRRTLFRLEFEMGLPGVYDYSILNGKETGEFDITDDGVVPFDSGEGSR